MGKPIEIQNITEVAQALNSGALVDGSVTTAKLAAKAVTAAKLGIFVSAEQTADGTAQSVAHGLGVEPSLVLVIFSSIPDGGASYTFTKGSTNVNVTATTASKYFVVAIV